MGNQGLQATRFSCSCGLGLFFGLVWFGFLRWKIELIELDLIRDLLFVSFFFSLEKQILYFCDKSVSAKLQRVTHLSGNVPRRSADLSH